MYIIINTAHIYYVLKVIKTIKNVIKKYCRSDNLTITVSFARLVCCMNDWNGENVYELALGTLKLTL